VPLTHVRDGLLGAHCGLGEPVATIALVFIVDVDPDALSAALGPKAWPLGNLGQATKTLSKQLGETVGEKVGGLIRWLDEPLQGEQSCNSLESTEVGATKQVKEGDEVTPNCVVATLEASAALTGEEAEGHARCEPFPRLEPDNGKQGVLMGPDLNPEGWLCLDRPDGRQFWHHKALGPPPWEAAASSLSANKSIQAAGATRSRSCNSHYDTSVVDSTLRCSQRTSLSTCKQAAFCSHTRGGGDVSVPVEDSHVTQAVALRQQAEIARTPPRRRPQGHELRQLELTPIRCERGVALDFGATRDPVPCERGMALDFAVSQKAVEQPRPLAQALMPVHQYNTLPFGAQNYQDRMMACQPYHHRPASMPACGPFLPRAGWEFTPPRPLQNPYNVLAT